MREEFEKLPSVAKYLKFVFWNSETKGYCNNNGNPVPLDFATFINGAYYAFQEQQKKIEAIKAIAEKWENTEYTYNSDSTDTKIEQIRGCGREITQELSK